VSLRGITVRFGPITALEAVDLDLRPGQRHAVVGENGAGKSTLMKVLFGQLRPDAGTVSVGGEAKRLRSPQDAIALGIGMVHQHFELIAPFTVAENIVLGAEPGGATVDRRRAEEQVAALAAESGLPIDPRARVATLSVAAQQRVEILKSLYRRAKVLILDEPTAVLAPSETRDLWAATERLSRAGTTVVFITHKLDEVMAHADEVTVLRRGRGVFNALTPDTNPRQLAAAMVGNSVVESGAGETPYTPPCETGNIALTVRNLNVRGMRGEEAVKGANLELRAGEILGLAGVDGSGQVDLVEAIVGLRPATADELSLNGTDLRPLTVAARREAGIGYVPEDRHHRALVMPFTLEENAVLGRHRDPSFVGAGGWQKLGAMRSFMEEKARAFDVRGAVPGNPARSLSGGNQQKLVMARELSRRPAVLLASQPTRGLDFGASAFVHDSLRAERDRGAAVLVQSLDLGEVLALSDRVAVMLAGRVVAVLDRADATEERVGALMTGAES
jgi:simple sugar transport system ATP-binding protein